MIFTTLVTIVVVVAGAVFLTNKTLEVADLVTFMLYINNFTDPIKRLVSFNGAVSKMELQDMSVSLRL